MVISFNITDSSYTYQLKRSTSPTADPDFSLDMTGITFGVHTDREDIVAGNVYCYKGTVEKDGVISSESPVVSVFCLQFVVHLR